MTTFNNHGTFTGTVNQVGGDQYVGRQHTVIGSPEVSDALARLVEALDSARLTAAESSTVRAEVQGMRDDLAAGDARRESFAGRLERVTRLLSGAGALVGAGAALVGPITALAQWLGPLGGGVLGVLATG